MNLYDLEVKDMHNKNVSLKNYQGKVLLIVNTAPKCGFAPQYSGLEKLYENYKDQGFELLDFPSNQFLNQAPGTNEEIKSFCELTYGTQFQSFSKIEVNGKNEDPLYTYLKNQNVRELTNKEKPEGFLKKLIFGQKIKWNFTKFLVDKDGKVVNRFSPNFEPEKIEAYIKDLI
ncbi:MAG: glutathione peroxidase [Acholeplasmataceae bacterium]